MQFWQRLLDVLLQKNYPACVNPLPILGEDRKPDVSSEGHWKNSSRATHNGQDWMYRRLDSDVSIKEGDHSEKNKNWIVPRGTPAIAVRDGIVRTDSFGEIGTGYRCWIQHNDGYRSGYFHLVDLAVEPGQTVLAGERVGTVGDNPKVTDPRHLHFEVSFGVRYQPVEPGSYLKKHKAVFAKPRGEK